MLQTNPLEPSHGLDLVRSRLVPLRMHTTDRTPKLVPADNAYSVDGGLRKTALRARSVLAAAYRCGCLSLHLETWHEGTYLFAGESSVLARAPRDFATMIDLGKKPLTTGVKGWLPVGENSGGYRTAFGWLVLHSPAEEDAPILAGYLQASLDRFLQQPEQFTQAVNTRNMPQQAFQPMHSLFATAFWGETASLPAL